MLQAKVKIGNISEMPRKNSNCLQYLSKMSNLGFCLDKPSCDQFNLVKIVVTFIVTFYHEY